jgi:hypothetical protein
VYSYTFWSDLSKKQYGNLVTLRGGGEKKTQINGNFCNAQVYMPSNIVELQEQAKYQSLHQTFDILLAFH